MLLSSERMGDSMRTLLVAKAAACAVAVAMVASACGGFTAVDDNREEVCAQLAELDGPLGVMFPETNPEGNVAQARFGAAAYVVVAEQSGEVLNGSQETLLARGSARCGAVSGSPHHPARRCSAARQRGCVRRCPNEHRGQSPNHAGEHRLPRTRVPVPVPRHLGTRVRQRRPIERAGLGRARDLLRGRQESVGVAVNL